MMAARLLLIHYGRRCTARASPVLATTPMRTALTVAAIWLLSVGAWTWAVAELSGPHSTAPTATTAPWSVHGMR